jgi:hypothetical protein
MAGLRMSADEIFAVIGSGRNGEDTGKPISKATLYRHFKNELANGRAMLKARVAGKFYAALDEDAPWAIQMAMRNQFGWDNGRSGFHVSLVDDGPTGLPGQTPTMQIEFISPTPRELDDHCDENSSMRDVTPTDQHESPRKQVERRDYPAPPDPGRVVGIEPSRASAASRLPIMGRKRGFNWE